MDKWKQLEESLQGLFSHATVLADGHEVTFQKRLDGEKLVIQVGVDGWIKGMWSSVNDQGEPVHPEGRFYRPYRCRAWKLKDYKALKTAFGKKKADQMTALKTVAVTPLWNSPRSLISHLKRHFPDLEIKQDQDEVSS